MAYAIRRFFEIPRLPGGRFNILVAVLGSCPKPSAVLPLVCSRHTASSLNSLLNRLWYLLMSFTFYQLYPTV